MILTNAALSHDPKETDSAAEEALLRARRQIDTLGAQAREHRASLLRTEMNRTHNGR